MSGSPQLRWDLFGSEVFSGTLGGTGSLEVQLGMAGGLGARRRGGVPRGHCINNSSHGSLSICWVQNVPGLSICVSLKAQNKLFSLARKLEAWKAKKTTRNTHPLRLRPPTTTINIPKTTQRERGPWWTGETDSKLERTESDGQLGWRGACEQEPPTREGKGS